MTELWSNLKQPKVRNEKHLKFIRSLCCIRCHLHPTEAAHIRKGCDGGMALKPSDIYTIPLCGIHHREQHQIGEVAFYKRMGKTAEQAIELAKHLYAVSGDAVKAFRLVMVFRNV